MGYFYPTTTTTFHFHLSALAIFQIFFYSTPDMVPIENIFQARCQLTQPNCTAPLAYQYMWMSNKYIQVSEVKRIQQAKIVLLRYLNELYVKITDDNTAVETSEVHPPYTVIPLQQKW